MPPLHVLIVEDSPEDTELIVLELSRGGFEPAWRRVETGQEMQVALAAGKWDVVLSEYTLPGFGASQALTLCREADVNLPFIVVSGTIGEEQAVALMRAGASDYLLKSSLARLSPAVERELREAANRGARQRAEEAALRLAAVVECTDDAIYSVRLDGIVTSWNPAAKQLYGWSAEEVVGRQISFLVPPDRAEELDRIMGRLARGERVPPFETVRLHKDGIRIDVSVTISPVRDQAGRLVGVSKIARDIRDRKEAEAALWQTSELLRAVADGMPNAVFVKDLAGRYLLFNEAAARFVGRPIKEVLGRDDTALFGPDDARQVMDNDRRVMESNHSEIQEEKLTAAGVTRTYLATKAPYRDGQGKVIGLLGISHDITARKRTEDALREKEAKLAEAVRLARMGYWSRDLATGDLDWSHELYGIFGMEPAAFSRTLESFLMTVHPDDRAAVRERIARAEETVGVFDHTYRILVRGEVRVIHEVGRVLTSEDGRPTRIAGTAQDVTEQARAEEALRLRDRAIGAATQGILITDANQKDNPIIYASPAFERLTGYTQEEVLGTNCRFLQGNATDPAAVSRVREAIREGRPCTVDLLNYRKDGGTFWNELSISPVRNEQGKLTHFVGVQTDVTRRKLLENQYHQAQKMEAVGQLAGGVAHDFNNLLTIISGYSDLLLMKMTPDDPSRALLVEIHKAGERSAALTRQLLVFSRKQVVAPKILDLNEVVADAEKMLHRLIGEDMRLVTALRPLPGRIRADPGQLEQVLMNLAVNARDAMPQGGRLTMETSEVELDEGYAGVQPGRYALLAVSDTGSGMPPEVRARIFEPFYTTKEVGKGTGLGLAVVHGIVKEAGGHLDVYSEVGLGTTFKIYLPLVDQPTRSGKAGSGMRPAPRGTETVLLVEDEVGVRALTRHVVAGWGYMVLEAADGDEALRIAERHNGPIHLLVTDVVMPGMGGRLLAERLQVLYPAMKVLYVSGYTDDAVVRHGILKEEVQFLQKPFSPLALAAKIREVLDSPGLAVAEVPSL